MHLRFRHIPHFYLFLRFSFAPNEKCTKVKKVKCLQQLFSAAECDQRTKSKIVKLTIELFKVRAQFKNKFLLKLNKKINLKQHLNC